MKLTNVHLAALPRGRTLAVGIAVLALASTAAARQADTLHVSPAQVEEGHARPIDLWTDLRAGDGGLTWTQVEGPRVPLQELESGMAQVDVSGLEVAADVELVFSVSNGAQRATAGVVVSPVALLPVIPPQPIPPGRLDPFLGPDVQIGGQTTAMAMFQFNGKDVLVHNVGNRLSLTPMKPFPGPLESLHLTGFIRDIEIVQFQGRRYALVAMGPDGIAAVDLSNPYLPTLVREVAVNFLLEDVTFAEGGGDLVTGATFSSTHSTISSLLTDGTTLWIGNQDYGLQRTALANLLGPGGPVLEPDGTLLIEHESSTLHYAGERPWGGPLTLDLHNGKLFVALQYLGLGVHEPTTLGMVGGYNLYTDVSMAEDWFVDMDVADEVQPGPAYLDPLYGMPTAEQASFEITQVWHGGMVAPTPWADFEIDGKYYYNVRDVEVVDFPGRSIAYLAYGLGGLVAVDVTGYETATARSVLQGQYLGYAPAVPAHGPDEPAGGETPSLFPHYGAGKLAEAGFTGVQVKQNYVFASEHFAGLLVLEHGDEPELYWHGPNAPYDNDTNGVMGDHVPDYEFVTSYSMLPYDPADHESLPVWMYEAPSLLVSGELSGHGNTLLLGTRLFLGTTPNADVALGSGAGGLDLIDLIDDATPQFENRFRVAVHWPTTHEVGADETGAPLEPISIGHTQGIAASSAYLYVGDGPHGVSAWKLVDDAGFATDDVHLVGNTVQDEYEVVVGGVTIYPASHAFGVVYDPASESALTSCQGSGLRRVPVAEVEAGLGQPGQPLLLPMQATDLYEHKTEGGSVGGLTKQDHAFDVVLDGDLAFVADGGNGLTVYDLSKDPTVPTSGFLAGNLGGGTGAQGPLGNASGVALYHEAGKRYALLACGPRGVGVVDATDVTDMQVVKVFEPIKIEDDRAAAADGRAVDVLVHHHCAIFSYDSFGVLCYAMEDLLEPLPPGVDPTEIWSQGGGFDYRPETMAEVRLRDMPQYEHLGGGALYMDSTFVGGRLNLFVAYGAAGLLRLDWTGMRAPRVLGVEPTVGVATAVAVTLGRVYVADGAGGLIFFK